MGSVIKGWTNIMDWIIRIFIWIYKSVYICIAIFMSYTYIWNYLSIFRYI